MNYPDYKSLPSWGGKRFNSALSLVYEKFAVQFWLDQNITKDKKYSIYQASAICGNTRQESVYNPTIQGDPTIPGFSNGLQQWNSKRNMDMMLFVANFISTANGKGIITALSKDYKEYQSLTDQEKFWGQLHFCQYEIQSPAYKRALQCLINNETDPDLAGKFGHIYEGFGDNSAAKRDGYAAAIVTAYKAGVYDENPQISQVTVSPKPVKKNNKSRH